MSEKPIPFGPEHAATYDDQFVKLAAIRDVMHLLTRLVLAELPDDAHILCVGAGTGQELIYLAQAHPGWQFTAVEPAPAMLAICRRRADELGITSRCTFHEGYLNTLGPTEPFDAAASLLVSHFIAADEERRSFYRDIAARLGPKGWLVNTELARGPHHDDVLQVWLQAMIFNGMKPEQVPSFRANFEQNVHIRPLPEVEDIITASGFGPPIPFLQTLLIHGWYTRRA